MSLAIVISSGHIWIANSRVRRIHWFSKPCSRGCTLSVILTPRWRPVTYVVPNRRSYKKRRVDYSGCHATTDSAVNFGYGIPCVINMTPREDRRVITKVHGSCVPDGWVFAFCFWIEIRSVMRYHSWLLLLLVLYRWCRPRTALWDMSWMLCKHAGIADILVECSSPVVSTWTVCLPFRLLNEGLAHRALITSMILSCTCIRASAPNHLSCLPLSNAFKLE